MPLHILTTILNAWRALVILLGAGHAAVGVALLADGPDGLTGPVFARSNSLPWWVWGTWALAAGILIVAPRTTVIGLAVTAGWYSLWAALIVIGLVAANGPYYAIPVYLLLAALHLLVLLVEWSLRPRRRRT